ncbi:phage tail protein [Escherichia coli]|uniref:phage tail protein n=2 Tax=Escherichia coli TaxID=562 RepID=UPI000C29A864|nr:phage tail protein [Escherichia coli]EEZ4277952.1 phage tail protein [Escherichia coli]EFM0077565.1 phage tail protein [Escherichia coli]EHI0033392.1 phage tail protein [Escherichia coli]EJT9396618.1 phage tail protein [Escherichia coli]EJU6895418.1 phage tail protein [Escherichia coli]
MTTKHCSILTNRGKALEAASAAGGAPVVLDGFVVGDGNGNAVTPEAGQTALVREVYRGIISRLAVSPDQENQFIAYLALPEGVGGFTVREAGLLTSDGELYAVGSCAAIEKPINGVTATLQFRLAVAESAQVTLNVATGDGLFLRQDRNLSDVEDRDKSVENLGLKPTVDKAKNAVQRDGDTMSGELKIRGVNALRIFNEAFGLIFRRSEESLHLIPTQENQGENGDIGPLRPFSINLRTGEVSMSHPVSVGDGSKVNGALGIGVQNALGGNSIALGGSDTGLKQNGDGLLDVYANGQHVFRFQNGALQSNRAVNVSGRVTPSDYGNFDARYQQRNGGVQDVRYGSEMYYNPGGNEITWTFRSPSGHGLSGIYVQDTGRSSADNIGGVYYRPLQKLINGTWYNVASV